MKFLNVIVLLFFLPLAASAQIIKIGSIAPDRSPWNEALKEIGREWEKISNGQVKLKIYPGGIAGSEDDMIRKMKLGTLGGAVLTNIGITKINPDAFVLNTPFLFNSEKEMSFVMGRLVPIFEKQIQGKRLPGDYLDHERLDQYFSQKIPYSIPRTSKNKNWRSAPANPKWSRPGKNRVTISSPPN